MKKMVEKVKKAEEIILGLKRTGHATIHDLLNSYEERMQTILKLEDQNANLTSSEKFAQENLA